MLFPYFPKDNEKNFKKFYFDHTILQFRISVIFGLFMVSFFGLLDKLIMQDFVRYFWIMRYAIFLPVCITILLLSYLIKKDQFIQSAGTFIVCLCGTLIVGMIVIAKHESHLYYAGLMLTIFYAYGCLRLRFVYSTIAGWFISILYLIAYLKGYLASNSIITANNMFFLTSSNIIGMFISYFIESHYRKEYLYNLSSEQDKEELKKISVTDPISGLPNRRYFDIRYAEAWKLSLRNNTMLALAMVDIDHFKKYNELLGHKAGDKCIEQLSTKISKSLYKPGDFVARYGGEEFVIIMPDTSLQSAIYVAERLRRGILDLHIPNPNLGAYKLISVSIGVSAFTPTSKTSPDKLISEASQALNNAKNDGRNRVSYYFE